MILKVLCDLALATKFAVMTFDSRTVEFYLIDGPGLVL